MHSLSDRLHLCLTALFGLLLLAAAPPPRAETSAEIDRLVSQLGADTFREREDASRRLEAIGEPALDTLRRARVGDDAEIRRRATRCVASIEAMLRQAERLLIGHTDGVLCLAVSGDGKRILTGSADRTLRLWDADTGTCVCVYSGHTGGVRGAALSADGARVLSGSDDKTVRLWEAATGKELRRMTGHTGPVASVAFGPGGTAISGSRNGLLYQWDLKTGKDVGWACHEGNIEAVAYSGKAGLAATSSMVNQSIRLWNLKTCKEVRKIVGGRDYFNMTTVCFSPDGKWLLSAEEHADGSLRLWDVETAKEWKRIDAPTPHCAAFSPDGKRLVSGGYKDKTVRVWDVATGEQLRGYEGHTGSTVTCVAFFPDGRRIVSGAFDDPTARVWRAPR